MKSLTAARILEEKCATPFVHGAPSGYEGTLKWLGKVGESLGRKINPKLVAHLPKRIMESRQYRMYTMMLKENKTAVTVMGEYMTVQGISDFLNGIGFPVAGKVSAHSQGRCGKLRRRMAENVY